jgi:adenylate cyclase
MRGVTSKYLPALLGAMVLALILAWLQGRGAFDPLELRLLDFRFLVRGNTLPPQDIVIVTYDEASFQAMEGWPWPRTYHAEAIRKLKQWGAKVIAFDQLFLDPSKLLPEDQDETLAGAMREAGNVVTASKFDIVQELRSDPNDPTSFIKIKTQQYLKPMEMFSQHTSVGYLNMIKDTDGYVRRIPLMYRASDEVAFAFSLVTYLKYKGLTAADLTPVGKDRLRIGDLDVPIGQTKSIQISYFGVPGIFPRIPFYQILKDEVDPARFRDKIVMIGPTALEFHDSFYTPFYGASRMETPGVEIHANAVATLLTAAFLRKAPESYLWLSLFAFGLVMAFLASYGHAMRMGMWALIFTVLQLAISLILFLQHKTVYPTSVGIVQIWLTYGMATMYRTFVGERRAKKLKSTFKRYVSKDVVDEILKHKGGLSLTGDKKRVTVLFSDIRGFTSMSEKMDPKQLVRELNEYFHEMVQVIFRHGGTLDKFMGDAVMAVWGSPLPHEGDELRAVQAAWEMQRALRSLNERRSSQGKSPIHSGVGINTGEAVVGNLGSEDRMEYTVIGDTVNTACRIEGQTTAGQILIHEDTYNVVKEYVQARPRDPVKVKGKAEPLQLYEVTGLNDGTG